MVELSKIEEVDLQEIWSHEAHEFTPWLADNLADLGEALGLELELRGTEVPVGSYRLDILAHDIDNDRSVVIENQLGQTDHPHLGQILTYAAWYDADTIVWIAREFRDEHRAALDYLNGRTGEDTEFFGVVVEVWKIDNSRPAPHFNLVVAPNVVKKQTDPLPLGGKKYLTFWQPLVDTLREEHGFTKVPEAKPEQELRFHFGLGGVSYRIVFAQIKDFSVHLYIDNNKEWNEKLFDQLEKRKETIESELGKSLSWERLDNKNACRIRLYSGSKGTIDDNPERLAEIREWMVKWLLAFRRVFGPELKKLAPIVDELAE